MTKLNIKLEYFAKKKRTIKVEKNREENFQLFR